MSNAKHIGVFNEYVGGYKKYKVFKFFGLKIKIRVRHLTPREFCKMARVQPLDNSQSVPNDFVNLSIAAIYKNEPDIIEWIEYHKLIGVQRFYLYDNESDDNSKDLLQPYIDDGVVIYHYVKGKCKQMPVYQDAIYRYKNETKWLAIIDLDEYIVPEFCGGGSLSKFLINFEDYPAIGINWEMFDSNGHIERPNMLVIEAYTRIRKNPKHGQKLLIKSIVNPRKVRFILNPHYCVYKKGELAVDENFEPIGNSIDFRKNCFTKAHSVNKIQINHYHTKSFEDYCNKRKIGYADSTNVRPQNSQDLNFEDFKEDYKILKFLPELKRALKLDEISVNKIKEK